MSGPTPTAEGSRRRAGQQASLSPQLDFDLTSERIAFATQYIDRLCWVLRGVPVFDLARALELLEEALLDRCQVFLIGNGGSASTASHMACDLQRCVPRGAGAGFRVIALSDNMPIISGIANDIGYEEVFTSQLAALAQPGDLLIAFSASGNSPNIVAAVALAAEMQVASIAFLGMGGGKVADMADVSVVVPSDEYGPVEDAHMMFDHLVSSYIRSWLAAR